MTISYSKHLLLGLIIIIFAKNSFAQTPKATTPAQTPPPSTLGATRVNINQIQQKYMTNNTNEIQVVQNRKYPKSGKFELGLSYGMLSADPFIDDTTLGAFVGYHFSEFWGLRAFYWKDSTSKSDGWNKAQTQSNIFINTNAAQSFTGAEIKFVPMYGKLSLLGKQIIYFDFNLFAGGGIRKTESGSIFSPVIGFGQQFYFTKYFVCGIDYRLMHYTETIIDQQKASPTFGQSAGSRTSFTHNILLNFSVLL